ncbi:hypothetical protein BDL97_06G017200 [Sphagnum fallax]|nr:hypothetical protein BDL97_06G017200 [Sphagnum fallax]
MVVSHSLPLAGGHGLFCNMLPFSGSKLHAPGTRICNRRFQGCFHRIITFSRWSFKGSDCDEDVDSMRQQRVVTLGLVGFVAGLVFLPATATPPALASPNPALISQEEAIQMQTAENTAGSMTYGQILAARDNIMKDMYTRDAWLGMIRLKKYEKLVNSMEAQEKLCRECTRNRRLMEQVWQTVSNEYYDNEGSFSEAQWSGELYRTLNKAGGLLHTKAETYQAVKEMVANLGDRYSAFLIPEEYRLAIRHPLPSELKYLAYRYTGIGMEAGILGGELLWAVDGIAVDSLTRDEAGALLRGPIGSMVELEVRGDGGTRTLLLERRALPLPPMKTHLLDTGDGHLVAYLRLHYFTHEGTKKMAAAIREGEALGVDGYILDLRNNPGGVFEEAIAMAALWLDCKGCDVTETVRSSGTNIEDLVYTVGNLPVITGALHDNHRVFTIGERTFGKGVVQYFFPMDDGSGLKLTVAKYLTPARYDISRQGGLQPDKACSDYPHGGLQSDKCIELALGMLLKKAQPAGVAVPAPMPYRWLPLMQRRISTSGTY